MTHSSEPVDRLEKILSRMEVAATRSGREPGEVTLVAVSKKYSPEDVCALVEGGQRIFGESRVQEALSKIPLCPGRLEWHFIGHLQKNKIRKAIGSFALFHGVDSLDLARDIDRIAEEEGQRPKVLLEVNTSGESSKFGFSPEALEAGMEELLAFNRLEIRGLMTMAPAVPDPELARPFFALLRQTRDHLESRFGAGLPELSMGMSGDFAVAIEEGSTMVRIGTALFGDRAA